MTDLTDRVYFIMANLKFKVKSDPYQYILYAADSEAEHAEDDPADNMKGYKAVGHYSTIEGILEGVRQKVLKSKTKRARDLEDFLKVVIGSQQEIRNEIKKLAFVAGKRKAPNAT